MGPQKIEKKSFRVGPRPNDILHFSEVRRDCEQLAKKWSVHDEEIDDDTAQIVECFPEGGATLGTNTLFNLGQVLFDLAIEQGPDEGVFSGKVLIERTNAHSGDLGDSIGRTLRIVGGAKNASGRFQNGVDQGSRSVLLRRLSLGFFRLFALHPGSPLEHEYPRVGIGSKFRRSVREKFGRRAQSPMRIQGGYFAPSGNPFLTKSKRRPVEFLRRGVAFGKSDCD
jgi:hypothetical protein